MALAQLTDLPKIVPVRDPNEYEVNCGGYRTAAPVAAVYTLAVVDTVTNGMTFTIALPDAEVVFTWVSGTVDTSGTQVEVGGSNTASATNLYDALRANYWIFTHFEITRVSFTVTLTQRTAGAITVGFTNTAPVTLAWTEATAGTDGTFAENYTANLRVWVEETWGSGIYTALPAYDASPDEDRRARWNVASLLYPYVEHEWPAYGRNTMLVLREIQKKFFLDRWESFGDPPSPQRVDKTLVKKAYFAGSRTIEHDLMLPFLGMIQRSDALTPFLTFRGRGGRHEVSAGQQHYLGWYRNNEKVADAQFKLHVVVTYDDGTTQATDIHTDTNPSGWERGDIALFPIGFDLMLLNALSVLTPVKYTLTMWDDTNAAVSETHTCYLVDVDDNERHWEWINSLGVVESTRLIGKWVHGITAEYEEVTRLLTVINSVRPSIEKSNRVHNLQGAQQTEQLSTGYMPRWEMNALVDALLSPEHRMVDHERDARHPMRIVSGQLVTIKEQGTDNENLYALNLEVLVSDPEMAWSHVLAMPAAPGGSDPDPEREPG